ncbi:MAG: hypothetical protein AAB131_04000 [Actinomycetota bacterium]
MAAVHTATYLPLGVEVTVASESIELLAAIDAGLGRYPSSPMSLGGELAITATVKPDAPDDPAWPSMKAATEGERMIVNCGTSTAVVDMRARTVSLTLAASICAVPDALRLFVESAFTAVNVHAGRLHAIHSALVVADDTGLVLRGPSGGGKSTLTYACLRRGMSVASDDWIYGAAGERAGTFAGYPWRIMLTEVAAGRFVELASVAAVAHPSAEGKKVAIVPPIDRQVPVAHAAAIVLLDPRPLLRLSEITHTEALERFWASSLPSEREHLDRDWVSDLLRRPTYLLCRGGSPVAAAHALHDLAVSLR